ncbi:ubiquitin-like domain-containing protein [Saxibacter everestensis]|uniref:Ubiquitin-like domain-containing protein n=1 Tax=Saxibacter everestensis TaxID=2909229 RepID=A0ABY8QWR1_9MICO|nr:ubiquitin-like domain-containing protein [Brevibacteriaceae bacterium ZFBP1038]
MIGAQAIVIGTLVAGTAAFVTFNKSVSVSIDGKTEDVRTFGRTVSDVLAAQNVKVGSRDEVAPAPDSKISNDTDIVVNHSRQITLNVDGRESKVWTTARTVDEALDDAGVRAENAELSASRSKAIGRDGIDLSVNTEKQVQILVDGKAVPVKSTSATVGDALNDAGIKVGKDDIVSLPAVSPIVAGAPIKVLRVKNGEVKETKKVAHETETKKDSSEYEDYKKVTRKGEDGTKEIVYKKREVDGEEVAKSKVEEKVTKKPVKEVVTVGTKKRSTESDSPESDSKKSKSDDGGSDSSPDTPKSSEPSGSVWDRLAKCESGGDWHINTGNGYYGGLQFNAGTWKAYGGKGMPHENSREQQIAIAKKVQKAQGWGAWPACTAKLGIR